MAEGKIRIVHLAVKPETELQARVVAELQNSGEAPTPPATLALYFYDSENRVRDRVMLNIKELKPSEKLSLSAFFRLKNNSFFYYTADIQATGGARGKA